MLLVAAQRTIDVCGVVGEVEWFQDGVQGSVSRRLLVHRQWYVDVCVRFRLLSMSGDGKLSFLAYRCEERLERLVSRCVLLKFEGFFSPAV